MRTLILLLLITTFSANASPTFRGLQLGDPVATSGNDTQCIKAYNGAEQALIKLMPENLSTKDVEWKLMSEHALIGIWFSDTQTCKAFDIKHLEKFEPHHQTPLEVFDDNLADTSIFGKLIIDQHINDQGRPYYTVRDCPLCL